MFFVCDSSMYINKLIIGRIITFCSAFYNEIIAAMVLCLVGVGGSAQVLNAFLNMRLLVECASFCQE